MAVTPTLMRDQQGDGEESAVEMTTYHRTFDIGNAGTLADVNLEKGDALPEDSDTEIISSRIDTIGNKRVARVVAVIFNYE
jgi:hypothetical protein